MEIREFKMQLAQDMKMMALEKGWDDVCLLTDEEVCSMNPPTEDELNFCEEDITLEDLPRLVLEKEIQELLMEIAYCEKTLEEETRSNIRSEVYADLRYYKAQLDKLKARYEGTEDYGRRRTPIY